MKQFLSCDWGTSSFRLKLVDAGTLRTVADVQNDSGIISTNENWRKIDKDQSRFLFYASVISSAISTLEKKVGHSLSGVPVILSGMASSSLGMVQLPYKQLPFRTDGSDLNVERIKTSKEFGHDVFIISGVCSTTDVMRGEETQLVGSVEGNSDADAIYILPGTHSKHIVVNGGVARDFKTYMTGEIFSLLSKNSTLSEAVTETSGDSKDTNVEAFAEGVRNSQNSNILNSLFRTRARFLLDKLKPESNRSYLSGLLIGSEVRDLLKGKTEKIVVVSSGMGDHYKVAMQTLNVEASISVVSDLDVAIKGQLRIVSHMQ